MLLRFGIENFLSIKSRQELSLVASSLDDVRDYLIESSSVGNGYVLPAVVVYGANAAGKSNVISALSWARTNVLYSHRDNKPDGPVGTAPFLLDPTSAALPTSFFIDFVIDDVRYYYEFSASEMVIETEVLYTYPNERRQLLFDRRRQSFTFGRNLKGKNKVISELTRPNSLFVSTAAQNDHSELTKINRFFRSMRVDNEMRVPTGLLEEKSIDARVIRFLASIGTGVTDYALEDQKAARLPDAWVTDFRQLMERHFPGTEPFDVTKYSRIKLAHKAIDGNLVYFDFDLESSGTKRLLDLMARVYQALDTGSLIIIDELNASLHTQACEAVLSLFSQPAINRKGAQLIATTHDTNLLRAPVLRRDQVWFAEKDRQGATHLYPLTDIRTRKGDNIERGYLQGRYGAVPSSGSAADILT